jgi:hypothetical protein
MNEQFTILNSKFISHGKETPIQAHQLIEASAKASEEAMG